MSDAPARYRAAVLGHPIEHSLSPVLHRAAYAALGLSDRRYDRFDVTAEQLPDFLATLDATWSGLSLTMPLKEAVLPLLTTVSDVATQVTAVNTVLCDADGLHGHNTDVPGFVTALTDAGIGAVSTATILGAGATARSALAALARLGVRRVEIVARSPEAIDRLADLASRWGIAATGSTWGDGVRTSPDVVISTVPGSVAPPGHDGSASGSALFDVAYEPWPTPLARRWPPASLVIGGLDLLVAQAAEQVRLMTGRTPPVDVMAEAGRRALGRA